MGANYGAQIFNNAVSSIAAQQAVIGNISSNISNVNTEGYARRAIHLQTRVTTGRSGGFSVGNGELTRISDQFLSGLVRDASADSEAYGVEDEFLGRLEQLFSLSGERNTVGSTLTEFFTAVDNLSLNPASIELRAELVERSQDLVTTIKETYNSIAELQDEADRRLSTEIDNVNSLTAQIADLNGLISAREGSGNVAADERDKREMLLERLAEKIGFEMVETSDGSVTISLSSGFPLVSGSNSRDIDLTTTPSFSTGTMPQSLNGGILSHAVYDYDPGAGFAHIDLTEILQTAGGTIGGLITVRGFNDITNSGPFTADGSLVEAAQRVEAIAQNLLTAVNQEYLGPDEDSVTIGWQPSATDLDGNQPSVYGLFSFAYTGVRDTDGNGLPDDLGFANHGVYNYSSILQLTSTDPRDIAAGRDLDPTTDANITWAEGDNQNLLALSAYQTTEMTFSVGGSYSLTGATFSDAYNETVGRVGNLKVRASINASVANDNLDTARNRKDEVTGVSLDEEFTNLIKYQKAYEASAKLIRVARDLMDQLVSIL